MTTSYWLDQPYIPRPALSHNLNVDAAVVGAGMTGVALALSLRARRMRVALIEANTVAGGATGRNAGFVTSGLGEHYSRSVDFWGREDAAAISRLHLKNHEMLSSHIERYGLECGYGRSGSMAIAADADEEQVLRSSYPLLRQDDFPHGLLESDEVNRILGGQGFRCGLFNPSDAHVDPVRLIRGLARIAESGSARIFENSPIESVRRAGDGWTLTSRSGRLSAPLVFLACNAWVPLLCPAVAVQPVRGQCLVVCGSPVSLPETPCLTNYGSEYWRGIPGGAILGGMRRLEKGEESGYADGTTYSVQRSLEEFGAGHFPKLFLAAVTHRWSGVMAYTADGLPLVGAVPGEKGMYVSAGYTGHGFGYAFLAAEWLSVLAIEGNDNIHRLCRIDRPMRPSPVLAEL